MKRLFSLLTCCLLLFSSCEKETMLTIDQTSLSFTDAGGSSSITLTANKPWSASSNQSWCKVSPSGGEEATGSRISISCDSNTTYDARNATVTITCAELTKTVTVSQATNNGLLVSQTSYELTKAAQQLNIPVQANVKFSVEVDNGCKDWVRYNTTKGLTTSTVVLDIAENKTYDSREGKVTIKQESGSLSESIQIKQACSDGIEIDVTEYSVNYLPQTLNVSIKSNVEYTVKTSANWISISSPSTKALTPSSCVLIITENPSYSDTRVGKVLVYYKNIEKEFTVRQGVHYRTLIDNNSFDISFLKQTLSSYISSNTDLYATVPGSDNWLSVTLKKRSQNSNTTQYGIEISVDENNGKSRTSVITIISEDGIEQGTITVTQSGKEDKIVVSLKDGVSLESALAGYDLKSITSLTIKGSVSELDEMFLHKYLSHLVELDLSETDNKVITKGLYKNFKKLTFIYLPSKLRVIEESAFEGCSALVEISLPESVIDLQSNVFKNCTSLSEVSFAPQIAIPEIPRYAFSGCISLKSIIIPKSVKTIQYGAFSQCSDLESITFSEGIKEIASMNAKYSRYDQQGAFAECKKLRRLSFPSTLTIIGAGAFHGCSSLSEVDFGSNSSLITMEGTYNVNRSDEDVAVFGAFSHCTSLTSIRLPKSLNTLGVGSFYGCTNLSEVLFENESELKTIHSGTAQEDHSGDYKGTIGTFAYTAIKEIVIPAGVSNLYVGTFYGCSQLEKVSFSEHSQLVSINGGGYGDPFGYAFYGTKIKIFDASNCTNLSTCVGIHGEGIEIMKIGAITPPKVGNIILAPYSILYVPKESIDSYHEAGYFWRSFSTIREL